MRALDEVEQAHTWDVMGRGIVEPVDDFRASNPPAHPELLDALAKDFAQHGYDLRWLIRTITASRSFGVTGTPLLSSGSELLSSFA